MDSGLYQKSFNGGKTWHEATRSDVLDMLTVHYKQPKDVLKQIDGGEVISFLALRLRRAGMQQD